MKRLTTRAILFIVAVLGVQLSVAQTAVIIETEDYDPRPEIQYFRYNDARGVGMFEAPKETDVEYDGLKVRVGGDFALQFQGISQSNDLVGDTLVELGTNFNLPTANLNFDVQLYDGLRLHLRTYLSSRHHAEAWVKGGHMRIDKLDFISEGFLSGLMDITFIKVGLDEINYGDAHFRRSDNARAIFNPFVGNYIMDAFTTEVFGEVTVLHPSGVLGLIGVSNGRLNQSVVNNPDQGISLYGKLGYDKVLSDDLRLRLTGSFYTSSQESTRDYLYGGDRAGGRYYGTLQGVNDARVDDFSPRFNPRWGSQTAIQINPFVEFKGLELFGIYETVGNNGDAGGSFDQIAADLLYRFGGANQFYIGGRYNSVSGTTSADAESQTINRINVGGGWFLTKNVKTKLEYVTSSYTGAGFDGSKLQGAEFSGINLEATIAF